MAIMVGVPQQQEQHDGHPTICSRCKVRAMKLLPLSLIAFGSLAPQYAQKLWGAEITRFLLDAPFLAGAVSQISWVFLLIPSAAMSAKSDAMPFRSRARLSLPLALPLGVFVILVQWLWYASIARTNAPTNLVLWNTDTVTTPLVALVITRKRPTKRLFFAGILGLLGAFLAVGAYMQGNTILGCSACFTASLGYACYAVIIEGRKDPANVTVPLLLALEGVVASLILGATVGAFALISPAQLKTWFSALPHVGWVAFIGCNSVMLNAGWLWCIEMAGAFWTALAACGTVPVAVMLDVLLLGRAPSPFVVLGIVIFFVGFALGSSNAALEGNSRLLQPMLSAAAMGLPSCSRCFDWFRSRAMRQMPELASHSIQGSDDPSTDP